MSERPNAQIRDVLEGLAARGRPQLSLAERLTRVFEEESSLDSQRTDTERERWDDDEGSSGG